MCLYNVGVVVFGEHEDSRSNKTPTKLFTFWTAEAINWSLEHQSESCRTKRSDDKSCNCDNQVFGKTKVHFLR